MEIKFRRIVNLTPHEVVVDLGDGVERRYPPSGAVARVSDVREYLGTIDGVPYFAIKPDTVEGLPAYRSGVYYIVSRALAMATYGMRNDLLVPDDFVRDEKGQIRAAKAFVRIG